MSDWFAHCCLESSVEMMEIHLNSFDRIVARRSSIVGSVLFGNNHVTNANACILHILIHAPKYTFMNLQYQILYMLTSYCATLAPWLGVS